jgi:hypothetical protein
MREFLEHLEEQIHRVRQSGMTHQQKDGALELITLEIRDFLNNPRDKTDTNLIPF